MTFEITSIFAAIIGVLTVANGALVVAHRARSGISVGDGDNHKLRHAIRAHANLIEYSPIFLIVLGLLEASNESESWLIRIRRSFRCRPHSPECVLYR